MNFLLAAAAVAYNPIVAAAGPYGIADVPVINGALSSAVFTFDANDTDVPKNSITEFDGSESPPVIWENTQDLFKKPERISNQVAWNNKPVIQFNGNDFLDHQATSVGGVDLVCEPGSEFSVIQTFLPSTLNGGYLLSRAGASVASRMFGVWLNGDMRIYVGGTPTIIPGALPSTTAPNIYFFSWDGVSAAIYVNSGPMRVSPSVGSSSPPAAGFRLGARMTDSASLFTTSAGYGYNGGIGDFYVWNKAISLANANIVRAGTAAHYGNPANWGAFT